MKYFTMEELNEIAGELLENPSRETLKRLSDKYNGIEETVMVSEPESNQNSVLNVVPSSETMPLNANNVNLNTAPTMEVPAPSAPVWNPVTSVDDTLFKSTVNMQNNTVSNVNANENNVNVPLTNLNIPIQNEPVVLPTTNVSNDLNTGVNEPANETPNNNQVNIPFNGNLWEQQPSQLNNMMQTTDNFNVPIEQANNNSSVNQVPFFQGIENTMPNNSIPVNEAPRYNGPTMFGQIEQNFNNNAA